MVADVVANTRTAPVGPGTEASFALPMAAGGGASTKVAATELWSLGTYASRTAAGRGAAKRAATAPPRVLVAAYARSMVVEPDAPSPNATTWWLVFAIASA
jgi:hypothetical protein